MQLTDRGSPETQPREGGRGKGKPSQLEDWKSLKPKPPQPRGLVGLCEDVGSRPTCAKFDDLSQFGRVVFQEDKSFLNRSSWLFVLSRNDVSF